MRKLIIAGLVYISIAACGPHTAGVGSDPKGRDFVTTQEIEQAKIPGWSTWDLISRLRPHFLRSSSAQTLREREPVYAAVYVDEIFYGELESLKSMNPDKIKSIQYLNAYDATTRFGNNMPGGAIMILTH